MDIAKSAPPQRQFDFWLGHWDVYDPDGNKVGENRIEVFADGCGLIEHWSGSSGVNGKSLNMYDPADGLWHQCWVDSSGTRLLLDGQFQDGAMVLGSFGPDPARPGATLHQRISWRLAADASVRQLWETSSDGRRWDTLFDGRYVRRS